MKEITLSEAEAWSLEVNDPRIVRPTEEEWALVSRVLWKDVGSEIVKGHKPVIVDPMEVLIPLYPEEMMHAPLGLVEIISFQDKGAYNHSDPPGTADLNYPGRNHNDEIDWEVA